MSKPKNSNVEGNKFKSVAPQLKEKALHRYMMGESLAAIADSIAVHPSTVSRWAKESGAKRGQALEPEANPMVMPQPDHVMDAFTKELRNQNTEAALGMFLEMQDGVEEKYRVLMAQQLYQIFHKVMQAPPQIRTWSDAEKAHRIMESILNPNKGKGGGGTSKLQIQFDVVKEKPTVIDADVVDAETLPPKQDEDSE
jgi:hypothetical protein